MDRGKKVRTAVCHACKRIAERERKRKNGVSVDQHHIEPTENPHERCRGHKFLPDLHCACGTNYFEHQQRPKKCALYRANEREVQMDQRYGVI